jgi:hypothetical protein
MVGQQIDDFDLEMVALSSAAISRNVWEMPCESYLLCRD